jgi:hypothetical protein
LTAWACQWVRQLTEPMAENTSAMATPWPHREHDRGQSHHDRQMRAEAHIVHRATNFLELLLLPLQNQRLQKLQRLGVQDPSRTHRVLPAFIRQILEMGIFLLLAKMVEYMSLPPTKSTPIEPCLLLVRLAVFMMALRRTTPSAVRLAAPRLSVSSNCPTDHGSANPSRRSNGYMRHASPDLSVIQEGSVVDPSSPDDGRRGRDIEPSSVHESQWRQSQPEQQEDRDYSYATPRIHEYVPSTAKDHDADLSSSQRVGRSFSAPDNTLIWQQVRSPSATSSRPTTGLHDMPRDPTSEEHQSRHDRRSAFGSPTSSHNRRHWGEMNAAPSSPYTRSSAYAEPVPAISVELPVRDDVG